MGAAVLLLWALLFGVQPHVRAAAPRPDQRSWTSDLIGSTQTPYNRTPAECYTLQPRRNSSVVLTSLLDDYHPAYFDSGWMERLTMSLNNFFLHNEADIIFFHTGWTEEQAAQLHARDPRIRLACIATKHWAAERNFTAWENVMNDGPSNSAYAGYRSMCKWYSIHILNVLHGMGYDWMIRIDTDSEFLKPIPYNIVDVMKAAGTEYGFRVWWVDFARFVRGLPEAAQYWLMAEGIKPTWIRRECRPQSVNGLTTKGWKRHIFYNNFFVTNLKWWVQPHIQGWLQHLVDSNGFYKFRWGDAPVQTLTLGMFMPNDKILEFDFAYKHKRVYPESKFTQRLFPRYDCSRATGCEVVTRETDQVAGEDGQVALPEQQPQTQVQGQLPGEVQAPVESRGKRRGRGKRRQPISSSPSTPLSSPDNSSSSPLLSSAVNSSLSSPLS